MRVCLSDRTNERQRREKKESWCAMVDLSFRRNSSLLPSGKEKKTMKWSSIIIIVESVW